MHEPVTYTLLRSRRRTIAIHVHDGRVEVRAPLRAAQRDIDGFVQRKSSWIAKKLAELRVRSVEQFRVDDGCVIEVMGEALAVYWQVDAKSAVVREGDALHIYGPALDADRSRKLFLQWLAAQARTRLLPLAEHHIARMGLSHRCSGFTLRYTRSLWGRCSGRGNILFNPLILLAPLPVIDYLVIHEASHLRHMNHSREFWQLVASYCEDWQANRRWLKEHGHRLRVG